ncbi:hypothetical protein [Streptomyces sp. NPDC087300]|uniref:hypothetical protein n=1 Tax=Streptomyces sp. NPDC087300 TaxID=3365780 RepID=UPI003819B01E
MPEQLTHLTLDAPHPVEGLAWLSAFPSLTDVWLYSPVSEAEARQVPPHVRLTVRPSHGN